METFFLPFFLHFCNISLSFSLVIFFRPFLILYCKFIFIVRIFKNSIIIYHFHMTFLFTKSLKTRSEDVYSNVNINDSFRIKVVQWCCKVFWKSICFALNSSLSDQTTFLQQHKHKETSALHIPKISNSVVTQIMLITMSCRILLLVQYVDSNNSFTKVNLIWRKRFAYTQTKLVLWKNTMVKTYGICVKRMDGYCCITRLISKSSHFGRNFRKSTCFVWSFSQNTDHNITSFYLIPSKMRE